MNARDLFKQILSELIAGEQGEYPLDLRAGKAPFSHKDNEIFLITELDECFDYVKDSKEWFVDIYVNTLCGKFPHADYTGSALTSLVFEEALKKSAPLSAEEKFDARLKELGIYEDWCQQGCIGRVGAETSTGISILVHEDEDDKFTEFTYPPMSEMQKDDQFRIKVLKEFYPAMCDDSDFRDKLVRWVMNPNNVCPLFPVDVYFPWDKVEWQDFEDDEDDAVQIMSGTTSHDKELVKRINKAYNEYPRAFHQIASLLMDRDVNFEEENGCEPNEDDLSRYCENIADDEDLRTILSYCRM